MLEKINRKNCLKKFPSIPHTSLNRNKVYFPDTFKSYVLTTKEKFIRTYATSISKEFKTLLNILEIDSLVFIGDNSLPWLYQKHDYSKVQNAIAYLKQNKVTKKFNGGLVVHKQDLSEFTKHFFWLVRCCAALPIFHFINKDQTIVGFLCQYGNFHIYTLNKTIDKKFNNAIKSTNFIQIPYNSCYNKFGKTSAIRYRQTIM